VISCPIYHYIRETAAALPSADTRIQRKCKVSLQGPLQLCLIKLFPHTEVNGLCTPGLSSSHACHACVTWVRGPHGILFPFSLLFFLSITPFCVHVPHRLPTLWGPLFFLEISMLRYILVLGSMLLYQNHTRVKYNTLLKSNLCLTCSPQESNSAIQTTWEL
jgi:hypothetical protein